MKCKIILLSVLMLASPMYVLGQDYQPLLKDGKVWNYELHYMGKDFHYKTCESKDWIDGDTVIDGRHSYKMYHAEYTDVNPKTTVDYWYEEEGKVYMDNKLIYDFTLAKGDSPSHELTWYENGPQLCKVAEVDTVQSRGVSRKRMTLEYYYTHTWIEGVGNRYKLDETLGHPVSDGKEYILMSCYEDGQCIFEKDDFDLPSYNAIHTPTQGKAADGSIYDLQGRRIAMPPSRGVYIRDGRKLYVK